MKVVFINQKGAELLGRPRQDIIGSNWLEGFVPPESRRELRGRFEGLLRGTDEPVPMLDFPVMAAEGVPTRVEWRLVVLKDDAGNRTGLFGTGHVRGGPGPAKPC
jgi:PAS domain S-box-containing protein